MITSAKGIEFIGSFEKGPAGNQGQGGFAPRQYFCPAHKPTIGFGHVVLPGQVFGVLDYAGAVALLRKDLAVAEAGVSRMVTAEITQEQFDALVSFEFNLGGGALHGSHLLIYINAGDYTRAGAEFARWNHANGQVMAGLTERRNKEANMFLHGIYENHS